MADFIANFARQQHVKWTVDQEVKYGQVVRVSFIGLREEKISYWILEWETGIVHKDIDQSIVEEDI